MLSPSDADLVARDQAIPGLGTLLDPDAFAAALRLAFPHAPIIAARARYVRYKAATNCLAAYVIEVGGKEVDVYAKAYGTGSPKLGNSGRRMQAASALGPGGAVLADLGTAVYVYPNDGELTTLPHLGDPDRRARLVARLLPDRPDLWRANSHTLRYKPERRFVARLRGNSGDDAVIRVYSDEDHPNAVVAVQAFASGNGPSVVTY